MKSDEFLFENYIQCPFSESKIQEVLFHGTNRQFGKFNRTAHGIYVTPIEFWAKEHYGNIIIPLYANVTKVYKLRYVIPEEDAIIDLFSNRDYKTIEKVLNTLSDQGFNCCSFGGESEAMVLFGNIDIVNASTGKKCNEESTVS